MEIPAITIEPAAIAATPATSSSVDRCLVYCRLRPNGPNEFGAQSGGKKAQAVVDPNEKRPYPLLALAPRAVIVKEGAEKQYDLDGTFPADSAQVDVFAKAALPCVQHALRGLCAAVMCYGQTGTGKSFTMCNSKPGQEGVVPLSAAYLFAAINRLKYVPFASASSDPMSAALPALDAVCPDLLSAASPSTLAALAAAGNGIGGDASPLMPMTPTAPEAGIGGSPNASTSGIKRLERVYLVEAQFVQIYRDNLGDLLSAGGRDRVDIHFDAPPTAAQQAAAASVNVPGFAATAAPRALAAAITGGAATAAEFLRTQWQPNTASLSMGGGVTGSSALGVPGGSSGFNASGGRSASDAAAGAINAPTAVGAGAKFGGVSLTNCSTHAVSSAAQFVRLFERGFAKRVTVATAMNPESSRGHAALVAWVSCREATDEERELDAARQALELAAAATASDGASEQARADAAATALALLQRAQQQQGDHDAPTTAAGISMRRGKVTFIDLAGYERFSKTGIDTGSDPIRKDEAKTINASLLSLGHVVTALSQKERHIPWRNSKLTRLLQDSIGGRSRTTIILTVGPSSEHYFETSNTLQFGQRAMSVRVHKVRAIITVNYQQLVAKLQQIIEDQQLKIEDLEARVAAASAQHEALLLRHADDLKELRKRQAADLDRIRAEGATKEEVADVEVQHRLEEMMFVQQQQEERLQMTIFANPSVIEEVNDAGPTTAGAATDAETAVTTTQHVDPTASHTAPEGAADDNELSGVSDTDVDIDLDATEASLAAAAAAAGDRVKPELVGELRAKIRDLQAELDSKSRQYETTLRKQEEKRAFLVGVARMAKDRQVRFLREDLIQQRTERAEERKTLEGQLERLKEAAESNLLVYAAKHPDVQAQFQLAAAAMTPRMASPRLSATANNQGHPPLPSARQMPPPSARGLGELDGALDFTLGTNPAALMAVLANLTAAVTTTAAPGPAAAGLTSGTGAMTPRLPPPPSARPPLAPTATPRVAAPPLPSSADGTNAAPSPQPQPAGAAPSLQRPLSLSPSSDVASPSDLRHTTAGGAAAASPEHQAPPAPAGVAGVPRIGGMNIPMLSLAGVHLDNTMASVGPMTAKQLANLNTFGFGAAGGPTSIEALLSARRIDPSALQPLVSARQEQLASARVQDPMYQQLQTSHQLLQRRMQMVLEELNQVTTQVEDLREKKKKKDADAAAAAAAGDAPTTAAGADASALDGTMGEAALLRQQQPQADDAATTTTTPAARVATEKEARIEALRQELAEKDRIIETMLLEREGQEEEAARAAARQGDADYQHELEMQRLLQELLRLDADHDTSAPFEQGPSSSVSLPAASSWDRAAGSADGPSTATAAEDESGSALALAAASEGPETPGAAAAPSPLAVRRRQSMNLVSGVKPRGRQPTARREVVTHAEPRTTSAALMLLEELEARARYDLEDVARMAGATGEVLYELKSRLDAQVEKALHMKGVAWYTCLKIPGKS